MVKHNGLRIEPIPGLGYRVTLIILTEAFFSLQYYYPLTWGFSCSHIPVIVGCVQGFPTFPVNDQ